MLSALDKAIQAKDPIVVTLWHPHWAYSRYDLKDLEDPKGAMGETEKLHIAARKGFTDDFPSISKALSNFTIDDKHLQSLEDTIEEADGDAAKAVADWRKKNKDFVIDGKSSVKPLRAAMCSFSVSPMAPLGSSRSFRSYREYAQCGCQRVTTIGSLAWIALSSAES